MTTLDEVLDFFNTMESNDDFNRLLDAMENTRQHLENVREAAVHLDDFVTVEGVTPKYLNGLQGEVLYIDAEEREAYVALTSESVGRLRFSPDNDRYEIGNNPHFVLPRVPLSCCTPESDAAMNRTMVVDTTLMDAMPAVPQQRPMLRAV